MTLGMNCRAAARKQKMSSAGQAAGGDAVMLTGALTQFTSEEPSELAKVYSLGNDGSLYKETAGHMVLGRYEVLTFSNVHEFVCVLSKVTTSQAISGSTPVGALLPTGRVVSRKLLASHPGAMTRTKEHFDFRSGVMGVMTLDYDPQPGDTPLTRTDLWNLLQTLHPALSGAGVVWWCSGSSHIFNGDIELQGLRGQRIYILVKDAGDIPRACEALAGRMWLGGHGRIVISSSGAMLERHLFDDAMGQPARLDFAGGAICKTPLSQRRGEPFILADGGFLDTRTAFPDLTASELAKVEALKQAAKDAIEPERVIVREKWTAARTDVMTTKLVRAGVAVGEAHERAAQAARAAVGGVLLGDYTITLEDGKEVTIGQVLDDRDKYHGAITLDPCEPEYCGRKPVGKLYLYGASPGLFSFAHGGSTYRLQRQPARVYLQAGRRAEAVDEILQRLASEADIFLYGGVLVRIEGGRVLAIKSASALSYLIGSRFALFKRSQDGRDIPTDLDETTARMVLSALGVC